MRWVTKVSGDKVFVLDTVDWLEHEYTASSVLRLKGVLGVDKGTIFPCFSLYRRYYGLHNLVIEGTHLNLQFTPTDITLVKARGNFEGKVLVVPPIVTQMYGGTFGNLKVDTMDVSHFDTGKVTNMNSMFSFCKVRKLDVSHFDTRQVIDMSSMFHDCQARELDVSHFDTSRVTNVRSMFSFCKAKELDVSHFDLSKVKDFYHMFYGYKGIIIGREHFPKEAFE